MDGATVPARGGHRLHLAGILIVDDKGRLRRQHGRTGLTVLGHEARPAYSGTQALDW